MFFQSAKKENQKLKIVIIDDETSFLNIFTTTFEKAGFDVKGFSNPKEALKNIIGENPDLILLDISMPELDGFQVFEHLEKDFGSKMPKILFLTNLGETVSGAGIDNHFAKSIGADGYIHKSDDLNNIINKVRDTLKK